jgi:outer membrane lipoprotein-sorting protein
LGECGGARVLRAVAGAGGLATLVCIHGATGEPAPTAAPELDGRAVMETVDARPRGGDLESRAVWRLIDRRGRERVRETRNYWRDLRGEAGHLRAKRLIVFDAPPDIRETAFLVWSRVDPDEDEQRWIYLPALRKVRRVAGRDRGKSFVGSDFNYDDLSDRGLERDEHRLLRVETRDGVRHYVVESTPREHDSPYARRIEFVDAERFTQSRIEYHDRKDRLEKVLEAEWQLADDVWAWKRLEMRNVKSGHRTVVEVQEVRHGTGLPDDLFTESSLRLGVP